MASTAPSPTVVATATKACAACAHYNATSASQGECRRHAPQTVAFRVDEDTRFESRFPTIKASDWCGEFFAKSRAYNKKPRARRLLRLRPAPASKPPSRAAFS